MTTNTSILTPEQLIVFQSFLIRQTELWQQYQREYPELLTLASYHICPDGAWIAREHEEPQSGTVLTYSVVRLSPACSHLIAKI